VTLLLGEMREVEAAAKTVHIELETTGSYPGGVSFRTKGQMDVLRGEHPAFHTVTAYEFGDGLSGRLESVRNSDGVLTLTNNPTDGDVFLQMDLATLADVEWASKVLQRDAPVPAATDARMASPLGSGVLTELLRQFDLKILSRRGKDGQEGIWIGGDLRPDLQPEGDSDLPLADHVEVFVRTPDKAILDIAYLQLGKVLQRIEVKRLVINAPMSPDSFTIDAAGRKPRQVRQQPQAWPALDV